jgi:predicted amidohydrolase
MERREFLTAVGSLAASVPPAAGEEVIRSTSQGPPRKVIVGTMMQAFWGEYPGLRDRLDQLAGFVDQMAEQSKCKFGRGLDLAVLPEAAVTGELGRNAWERAVPFAGSVQDVFSRKAREHRCYIVVPTYLLESKDMKSLSNAAILVGRQGELLGIYRKVHLVVSLETRTMEAGSTPGHELPVFNCDFGKLAVQICYDMDFDYGWRELARKGAELIVWPTQSPQTARPAFRAMQQRCYIVSSTWRHNASVFEPTGKIAAQIKPPESTLVHELDLSYAILPWSGRLRHGEALRKIYDQRVGFRYYEEEDCGIFWSNDPKVAVGEMVRSLDLLEIEEELARVRRFYGQVGVPGY